MNRKFWQGKRVFLTGHTGFKGSWLALWLSDMGAIISGYALEAPTIPSFFVETKIIERMSQHTIGDIRDGAGLYSALQAAKPEIVFHMAAQPLVRYSYHHPIETYDVNIMGTVNLLEAARKIPSIRAVINVTSDKCYENFERDLPYSEGEILGGYDPYSSSKACSEIVTAAYRSSFFNSGDTFLATARAGNVIGGGDWAVDRLVPDFYRALLKQEALQIRSANAIRPWQHVLEPLAGYLMLAENLYTKGRIFAEAWNFGPEDGDAKSVGWVVQYLCEKVPNSSWAVVKSDAQSHEAGLLKLNNLKAKKYLDWFPRWSIETALDKTIQWYQEFDDDSQMQALSLKQIKQYEDCGFQ